MGRYSALLVLLGTMIGSTVADGGGGGGGTIVKTTTLPKPEPQVEYKYKTETYIHTVVQGYTTTIPVPYTTTEYTTEYPPPVTTTESTTATVTEVVTATEVSVSVLTSVFSVPPETVTPIPVTETITTTTVVAGAPITVTTLSVSETEITLFITSTSVPEPETIEITATEITTATALATVSVTTPFCEFCKIDIKATELVFPYIVTTRTLTATTLDVFTTINGPNDTTFVTSTTTAPASCISTRRTTWEYSDVILTSGVTYIAFETFFHGTLEPRSDVYGCGELVSTTLNLGPSASEQLAARIVATAALTTNSIPAPASINYYLDSIPTVVQQLGGIPASSCDAPSATVTEAPTPTETLEETVIASGLKRQNHPPVNNALDALAVPFPSA